MAKLVEVTMVNDSIEMKVTEDGSLWLKENFTDKDRTVVAKDLFEELLGGTGYSYIEPSDIKAGAKLRAVIAKGARYKPDGSLHFNPKAQLWGRDYSNIPPLTALANNQTILFTKL